MSCKLRKIEFLDIKDRRKAYEKFSVVISRQFGSLGRPIAHEMSEILKVEYYDRDIVTMVAKEHNITIKEVKCP